MPARAVKHTVDFDRVAALPRRVISRGVAAAWARDFTREFARRPGVGLRDWQGLALAEVAVNRGAWLVLPVGQGKTLISYLLPALLDVSRAILVAPAGMRAKTHADFTGLFGAWDNKGRSIRFVSKQELERSDGADLLERIRPQLIVIDEGDEMADATKSAVKRIDRHVLGNPDVIVVVMTGTPGRKSIMNYWHLLCWALRARAPVPMTQEEAQTWADAIDERNVTVGTRPKPGPLGPTIKAARAWFLKRLNETPGVVIVDEDSCNAPLTVRVRLAPEDPTIDGVLRDFLVEGEGPGEIPVTDSLSRWRTENQLGLGFFQYWDPRPPEEWMVARRAFAAFVRTIIATSAGWDRPLDTEAQVVRKFRERRAVRDWLEIKPEYDPKGKTKVHWFSDSALDAVAAWLGESEKPGIVWCGSVEFQKRLAQRTGLTSYGRNGMSNRGDSLHAPPRGRNIIASWHANKRGFNLQPWARGLIVMPPSSAKFVEQLIGRQHRAGQSAHVRIDWLATSGISLDVFEAMLAEARHVRGTVGMTKKVLRAGIVRAHPALTARNRFRWARKDAGGADAEAA